MKSFLSSRVKQLNVGVLGYTDSSVVVDIIGNLSSSGTLSSTVPTGLAPLSVESTTKVVNLNADFLDGQHGAYYLDIANTTGTFAVGDMIYAANVSSVAQLPIGQNGDLLTVVNGIPSWESITVENLSGISGIEIYDEDAGVPNNFVGKVNKLDFKSGLLVELDPLDSQKAIINLDLSGITIDSIGAIGGIGIQEESNNLGEVQDINFVGSNITASVDGSTATITLSDNPSFQTVTITEPDGNPPLTIQSTTLVTYLNADLLDGFEGSYYRNANNLNAGRVPSARLSGSYNINISGTSLTATNASYINVSKLNDNSSYKLTFTDSLGGYQNLYIDDDLNDLSYTPSTGVLRSTRLSATVPDGTAPFTVNSTTVVSNLNADLLDDEEGSYYLNLDNATNVLDETKGGTGLSSYVEGDILYASGANTLARLPRGSDNNVLYIEGNNIVWKSLSAESVGAINGVDVEDNGQLIKTATTLNFNENIDVSIDLVNDQEAVINLSKNPSVDSITTTNDSTINGVRVGTGGGDIATNTLLGFQGLFSNTAGNSNVAIGYQSIYLNENGDYNVGVGVQSLFNNEGNSNVAVGHNSLYSNQTGNYNVAIGSFNGVSINSSRNILIGSGTSEVFRFDVPSSTQSQQLAIGHNINGTNTYWIVGDENYNIGLGINDPQDKLDIHGNIKLSGQIRGPANFVIDPATVGDDTGTVVIKGNLQIDGETTTINSTIVSIDDKNIVLASGALNTAAADGAGITIDGANATMLYSAINDSLVFNKTLYHNTDIVLTAASQFGGNVSGTYNNITVTDDSHNHSFDNLLSKDNGTGNYKTTGSFTGNTLVSTVEEGTAPLTVSSITLVSNLNVDFLDGQHGAYYLDLANATGTLGETKGGTGQTAYTTGDILYSSATDTLSKLTIGTPNQILSVSSTGIPEWINPTVAGINIFEEGGTSLGSATSINFVGGAITASFDGPSSTATITLSENPTFNTISSNVADGTAPLVVTSTTLVSNLNADFLDGQHGAYYLDLANATGILATTKGGTGLSSYTTGDILYSSATDTLSKLTIGTPNQILSVSASGIPEWINPTVAGINIFEEATSLGSATTLKFSGRAITATFDNPSSTATITLSEDPTFNTITSDVATGTAPLVVTSTTLVSNLNADLLDGQHGAYYLDLANATGILATTKGGTGLSTYTTGDILYSSAANTLSKLTIGSQNQILSVSASGIPEWINPTVTGINIFEEGGTSLGSATSINFVGGAITATFDGPSSTATITLSENPTFNTISSNVATGTAPLVVTSTTLVSNLNADLLDDQHGSYYLNLNNATGILATTKGGTGLSSYTTGDILYSSAANTLSKLTIGSQNQILSVSSTGIPEWINPTVAGINILEEANLVGSATTLKFSGRAITATFDNPSSTATITLSDTPTFSTITSDVATGTAPLTVTSTTLVSNLNADLLDDQHGSYYLNLNNATGTLGETKGGTGQTTYTTGDILYSSAANTLSKLTIGSQNQILSVSASGIPEWINPTVAGINILEEGTPVGSATSINFDGRAITATFATSTATITLSDTPTFSTITSDVATGTAPLTVTSTTLVSNLNADKLDDQEGTYYLDLANATGSLGETKGGTGQTTYATGDILYSSATDTLSKLTIGSQNQILSVSASGIPEWKTASGGASATVSATPPPNPIAGDLWYDSDSAALYVYYNDGNTSQWVSTSVGGGGTTDPQNLYELLDVDFGGTTPADKTVLTYSTALGAWQPQAAAQYYASFRPSTSTQSVGTNGVTIDFDEIVVRSDNWPLATVNNSGYIYVPVTGKYLVTVSIYVDTTSTSTRNAMETWLYSNANGFVNRAMSHAYNPLNTYYYASTHMSAIISATSTASYVCYAGASFNATAGSTAGNVTQDSRLNIVYLGE